MFAVVQLLGEHENLCSVITRNNNNTILVGDDDVIGGRP